ncbi:MAG TPA: hypothetical protein VF270_04645, partial [Ignavibacteriaceae bacterium]
MNYIVKNQIQSSIDDFINIEYKGKGSNIAHTLFKELFKQIIPKHLDLKNSFEKINAPEFIEDSVI